MHKPVIREPKKPYYSPILKIYGTVQELTKKVGVHGTSDGGTNPRGATKTHI
jgi:hypothetical protein